MCFDELKKGFSHLSPTTSFLIGFIGAILVLCTLGFFVFLGFFIKGKIAWPTAEMIKEKAGLNNSATNPPSQPESLTEPAGTVIPVSGRDHVRGSAEAKLTLIEYSDFECPFCKKFHNTMKQLLADYEGKIRWIYRHYPLSFHANAQKEAEAAECAYNLGGHEKFWQYADRIYERTTSNGTSFALADLSKLAAEIGLNKKVFEKCLNEGQFKDFVSQSLKEGAAAGIQGTPGTVLINAKGEKSLIKGAYPIDLMKQIIDQALSQ